MISGGIEVKICLNLLIIQSEVWGRSLILSTRLSRDLKMTKSLLGTILFGNDLQWQVALLLGNEFQCYINHFCLTYFYEVFFLTSLKTS